MKKYLIEVETIPDGDEFEVKARNKKEARKKAEKIMKEDPLYLDMKIAEIIEWKEK